MNITMIRRTGFACLALAVLVVLTLPIVQYAATAPGELEACVNPGNGGLRLVDAAEACHSNETRVTWDPPDRQVRSVQPEPLERLVRPDLRDLPVRLDHPRVDRHSSGFALQRISPVPVAATAISTSSTEAPPLLTSR